MIKRPVVIALAAACLVALPAADGAGLAAVARSATVSASAGGAVVTATLATEPGNEAMLEVTITPQMPGFHIYSLDLPPHGIDGLGVPTRIPVKGAFTANGQPQANVATQYLQIAALGVALPVYLDGPVTLTVPVARHGCGATDVIASYGLCSDSRCMIPVMDLDIALGAGWPSP